MNPVRKKNDNKIASKTLVNCGTAHIKEKERNFNRPMTKATEIAGDKFFKVNWYHPELRKSFPGNSKLWSVDKFYPYAKDGALMIDEPRFDHEIERSKQKAKVLEKINAKFLILKNGTEIINEEGL